MIFFKKTWIAFLVSSLACLTHVPLYAQAEPVQTKTSPLTSSVSFVQALDAYKSGRIGEGDIIASTISDPVIKAAMEWAAIRSSGSALSFSRLQAFLNVNPDFPMAGWIRRRAETQVFNKDHSTADVREFFKFYKPDTAAGKIALARIKIMDGDIKTAEILVRDAWRENALSSNIERIIVQHFPSFITEADRRYRAERLVYKSQMTEALQLAGTVGPAFGASLKAMNASLKEQGNLENFLNEVPAAEHQNAPYILAKAQMLRRTGKLVEAAKILNTAPRDRMKLVNSHEWWVERRSLTRKLLDAGSPTQAYAVASSYKSTEDGDRIDAEFTAGWIALRYLNDAEASEPHFMRAASFAKTPLSISRGNYWLGRARSALKRDAVSAYERASLYGITYYGQLASAALNKSKLNIREFRTNTEEKNAFEQRLGARVFKLLMDNNAQDLAQPLALDYAEILTASEDIEALNQMLAEYKNAGLALRTAKAAIYRSFPTDKYTFPQFGIPDFIPLINSAEKAVVYAVAKQESAFNQNAVSRAGARGLMQMMPATAAATARQKSVSFVPHQLTSMPQLNAQLGAAHLGELMQIYRGSYIMVFAAYNAGTGRVQEWVKAYGDPRDPNVDAIDWVERIPVAETRNYVQRVMENMQVYRALFSQNHALLIGGDMLRGAKPSIAITPDNSIVTGSLRK